MVQIADEAGADVAGAAGEGAGAMSDLSVRTVATLVARVPFFAALDAAQQQQIAAHGTLREVVAGQTVLTEGTRGQEMFLVASGAMQVWCHSLDGSELVLARMEAGDWFGEQALLPGGSGRRNASVRVLESGRLWVLDRAVLAPLFKQQPALVAQVQGLVEGQLQFRGGRLGERFFADLGLPPGSADMRVEQVAVGAVVFHQGDPADRVYLVLAGRALVTQHHGQDEQPLSELLPGQFFGELAVLSGEPRSASVRALEPLRLASVDGAWLRQHADPAGEPARLRLEALASMYLLPRRGLRTLQAGRLDGQPCWTAINHMPDGRRVVSTRLADAAMFSARVLGAVPDRLLQHLNSHDGTSRSIGVAQGRIVTLDVEGEWLQLGRALGLLVDGDTVFDWQLELFQGTGELWPVTQQPLFDDAEVVCACCQTPCGQLREAISAGCHTLEALAGRTGATRVCGGCTPLVKELLGHADWTPAQVALAETVADGVKRFKLRPLGTPCQAFQAGQHVVVQARVDGHWIQRAYTLSNAQGDAHYEITVKRENGGAMSRWLFERMRGDELLRISSPRGDCVAPLDDPAPVVCLVGGIGVTPALAFARALGQQPATARLHVDYSVSSEAQGVALGELRALQRADPRFSMTLRLTGRQGRLGAADAAGLVQRFPGAWFFLCGSTAYMHSVRALLLAQGVDASRVRIEVFSPAGGPVAAAPEATAQAMSGSAVADRGTGLAATTGAAPMASTAAGCPAHALVADGAVQAPATRLEEAGQMLRQFYAELGAPAAFEARWREVQQAWADTGTYQQTTEELTWAVRQAWRNSIRCVGRLYWSGLLVRDMRHVQSGQGMLDAIMEHIRLATNGGNLRPTITVFAPQAPDGSTPRVWSPQLFRYAGYRLSSGQVLGDPANLALTQAAMDLGWQPPARRDAFDLLPVVVQAPGEPPCWREISPELVLEVPIHHPQHAWFAELALKWYALPAVSGMRLDAGGLDYRAIPFNGWYQGTEIGARNFGDTYRYNLLPEVARRLGLDTRSERTLWRDRALIELNVAVLHSYERAGVTMMDHHASCSAFDKFEALEQAAGRPVHALWSWLVPPISGSAVGLYHRGNDWPTQELKPNYFTQPDPWPAAPG